ncbi:MAG: ABC transporter substrate-binding protein [Deltaproteobacteria bacterium]|nr:ABC transporter substrate-binding protein [Deltaproteobacteria bacterium]
MSKKIILLFSILFVVGFVIFAGGVQAAQKGPKYGGKIIVAFPATAAHLDPDKATDGTLGQIADHMFEGLFETDKNWKPAPFLAESYTMSQDGKTYRIILRRGIKFHDGTDMTSEDVLASMNRWLVTNGGGKRVASHVKSVTTPGPYEVVIALKTPYAPFLSFLSSNVANQKLRIRPREIVEKYGNDVIEEPIGTGPYQLVEWIPDQHVKMKRFESYSPHKGEFFGYYGEKKAYGDEIIIKFISETSVRIAGTQTGEFHFALDVPMDQYDMLDLNPDIDLYQVKPSMQGFIIVNKGAPPFNNLQVRQALLHAIKPIDLAAAAIGHPRFWFTEASLFPPGNFWNIPGVGAGKYNAYNPDKAKKLMAKGGYDGTPVVIINGRDNDYESRTALTLKQQLEEVGFKVDVQLFDRATVVKTRSQVDKWNLHASQFFTPDPDPQVYGAWMGTKKWIGNWDDADSRRIDEIFSRMEKEPDFNKRKKIVAEWQEAFFELVPYVKLYFFNSLHAANSSLKGFQPFMRANFYNCWLEK